MLATYGADFAADWGRKVRNTAETYRDSLSLRLSPDSQAANRWHTSEGGGMIANGVGGSFTGRGADLAICDDAFKNSEEANSAIHRAKVWEWWNSTFMTRLEPGAVVILTMTRWHVDDLAGRILDDKEQAGMWKVVTLPALAEPGDVMGRQEGEPLWPQRKALQELQRAKIEVGDYVWKSLYQQQPPNLDGGAVYHAFRFAQYPAGNIDDRIELTKGEPICLMIDFNKRPGSHAMIGQYHEQDGTAVMIEEIFTPLGVAKHISEKFVQWWRENGHDIPYVELYGDASGGSGTLSDGRSAWQTVRQVLDDAGVPYELKIPRKNPGIHNRIESVNNALCDASGLRSLTIHPHCTRFIRDLQKVVWDNDDLDKKTNVELTHMSDAVGYFIHWRMPIKTAAQDVDEHITAI